MTRVELSWQDWLGNGDGEGQRWEGEVDKDGLRFLSFAWDSILIHGHNGIVLRLVWSLFDIAVVLRRTSLEMQRSVATTQAKTNGEGCFV